MITYQNPAALAEALKRAEAAHEKRTGQDKDWPSFYAAFMDGEQAWRTADRPSNGFADDSELNAVLDSFPETPETDEELTEPGEDA